jgi:3-methyladenine DNA glycosylase AlkD
MLRELKEQLRAHASPQKARVLAGFFKTGPGQYGEGDVFLGVTVPHIRALVKKFHTLSLQEISELLNSEFHEERLCGLLLLVYRFERGDSKERRSIYRLYRAFMRRVNNWDLVDLSAPNIIGEYLLQTKDSGAVLVMLAKSKNLWYRRIAILATFAFIKRGNSVPTLNIARILLNDSEDLIHKAVGWMLREVGKRVGQDVEEEFLRKTYRRMPRTMLRYAIERFPRRLARAYMDGKI